MGLIVTGRFRVNLESLMSESVGILKVCCNVLIGILTILERVLLTQLP